MDLALDIFRNRIAESNKLGTSPTKWGDMKPADLEKEQAGHKVAKITDVTEVWKHQAWMYGDCQGMSVVLDTIELSMFLEKGVQPSKATMERAERVMPDIKATKEGLVLRRRLRDVLKAAGCSRPWRAGECGPTFDGTATTAVHVRSVRAGFRPDGGWEIETGQPGPGATVPDLEMGAPQAGRARIRRSESICFWTMSITMLSRQRPICSGRAPIPRPNPKNPSSRSS